ncbi:MAG: hypothetical protein AAGJ35_05520, partial [Myxococcota bacterium]
SKHRQLLSMRWASWLLGSSQVRSDWSARLRRSLNGLSSGHVEVRHALFRLANHFDQIKHG